MKHLKKGRKFSRVKKQRKALLKVMLGDLLMKRKITTTLAKAKELKVVAEKFIGQLKDLILEDKGKIAHSIRSAKAKLPRHVDSKTLREIAQLSTSRSSGYLRITRRGRRRSDGAPMAILEIIDMKNL